MTFGAGAQVQRELTDAMNPKGKPAVGTLQATNETFGKYKMIAAQVQQLSTDVVGTIKVAIDALKGAQAAYIVFQVGTLGKHAVALTKSSTGTLLFFDPNAGEYIVKDFDKFFAKYLDIYKRMYQIQDTPGLVWSIRLAK